MATTCEGTQVTDGRWATQISRPTGSMLKGFKPPHLTLLSKEKDHPHPEVWVTLGDPEEASVVHGFLQSPLSHAWFSQWLSTRVLASTFSCFPSWILKSSIPLPSSILVLGNVVYCFSGFLASCGSCCPCPFSIINCVARHHASLSRIQTHDEPARYSPDFPDIICFLCQPLYRFAFHACFPLTSAIVISRINTWQSLTSWKQNPPSILTWPCSLVHFVFD
jgi:hypothetical protein